jgi:hypothetical protein
MMTEGLLVDLTDRALPCAYKAINLLHKRCGLCNTSPLRTSPIRWQDDVFFFLFPGSRKESS